MNSILLICESVEDARCLLDTDVLPLPLKEIDILSMEPEIKSILVNHEISSMTSADFVNRLDYEIIDSDCIKIYSDLEFNIKQNIPSCYSKCIENMFLYYTLFSFYTIIWNARLLHNLLDLEQYVKIITFTSKKNVESSPWFISEQNILHLLISQVLLNKTFEHVILKNDGGKNKNHVSSFFLPIVRQFIKPVYSFMLRRISGRNGKIFNIMVPSMAKNMNILCSNLLKKHPNIIFFIFGEGNSVLSELYKFYILMKYFITDKGGHDPNILGGHAVKLSLSLLAPSVANEKSGVTYDFFNKIMLRIQESELKLNILNSKEVVRFFQRNKFEHIFSYLQYQQSLSSGLEKCIEFLKPDMIFSQMSLGITCMLGYLAESAGIPSMLISHGSHVLHTEGVAKIEHELVANNMLIGPYRFLGIQTVLSNEYVVKKKIPDCSIIKIKPTILSNNIIKRKIQDAKLTVLHAGSIKDGTNRHIYETPDELLETFKETIEILSTCQNIQLIIKFRQIQAFSFQSLKTLLGPLPDNVTLVSDGLIGDFLVSSHLLMSFSSTTIEEALINDTPVLLYGGKGRYSHIPTDPFKLGVDDSIMKPVTFVNNRKSLTDYFKILNKNHLQFIDHKFDFDRFRLKDSIGVLDWLEQNSILKET